MSELTRQRTVRIEQSRRAAFRARAVAAYVDRPVRNYWEVNYLLAKLILFFLTKQQQIGSASARVLGQSIDEQLKQPLPRSSEQ